MITPGQWIAKQLAGTDERGHVILRIEGPRTFRIDNRGEFSADDAKLIAAAPEILEALRDAAELLDKLPGLAPTLTGALHSDSRHALISRMRAAITKATKEP